MSYNSHENYGLSPTQYGIAGGASGFFTRLLVQPLDVIKIRFQLQIESTYGLNKGKYYGIFQALKSIGSQEGIFALWKGIVPCQLLTVSYGSGQFFSYFLCTQIYKDNRKEMNGARIAFCGGLSGAVGTVLSMPFDIARTRLIAQSKQQYDGMLSIWTDMYRKTGVTSLWRGLLPTLSMVIPSTAIQFRTYNILNEMFTRGRKEEFIGMPTTMLSGGLAGLTAKFVMYPLDVLKKRLQIMGSEDMRASFGKVEHYRNPFHIILSVTTEEGMIAWYKGLVPSLLKSYVSSALAFSFFELSCQMIVTMKSARSES